MASITQSILLYRRQARPSACGCDPGQQWTSTSVLAVTNGEFFSEGHLAHDLEHRSLQHGDTVEVIPNLETQLIYSGTYDEVPNNC